MLDAHRRYLAERRAACASDPADHRHQLAALEREIVLAAEAESAEAYLAASGDLAQLIEAERLDQAYNRLRVAHAVQDRWRAAAAAAEYRGEAPPAAAEAPAAFTRLLLMRAEAAWRPAEDLAEHIAGAEQVLQEADPAFDPGAPEYRRRTPWPQAPPVPVALATVDAPPPPPARPGDARLPLQDAPLRARVKEGRERLLLWPEPLLARHWDELERALVAARTPTQVALAADLADACLAVESDWNRLLHATLLAPLRAAIAGVPGAIPVSARAAQLLERELPLGAWTAEAGFELLQDLRDHPDPPDLSGRLRIAEPPPATLWDQPVDAADPSVARRPVPGP